jgi:hypothetical protein
MPIGLSVGVRPSVRIVVIPSLHSHGTLAVRGWNDVKLSRMMFTSVELSKKIILIKYVYFLLFFIVNCLLLLLLLLLILRL